MLTLDTPLDTRGKDSYCGSVNAIVYYTLLANSWNRKANRV